MLMTNTLFRVGGAAILLSNKRSESWWVPGFVCARVQGWGGLGQEHQNSIIISSSQ
jgi:hypothetical protein